MLWDLIKSYRQAFRIYMRTKTKPMTIDEAEEKRLFWAKVYAVLAFLSFVSCTYVTCKEGLNFAYRKDVPREIAASDILIGPSRKVVYIEGFKKVKEIDLTEQQKEESKS